MTIFSGPAQAYAVGLSFFANVTTSVTRPADTTAYAANDAISDSTSAPTVLTLAGVAQENKHGGIIRGCTLVKSTSTTTLASFSVLVLRTTFTALEDNAAVDLTDAEALTMIGGFAFAAADWLALTNNAVWNKTNLDLPFVCQSTSDDLYLVLRADAGYTPASAEVFSLALLIEWPA